MSYTLHQVDGKNGLIDVCTSCFEAFFSTQKFTVTTTTEKRPPFNCDDCKKSFKTN